jgi:hypothetical protein
VGIGWIGPGPPVADWWSMAEGSIPSMVPVEDGFLTALDTGSFLPFGGNANGDDMYQLASSRRTKTCSGRLSAKPVESSTGRELLVLPRWHSFTASAVAAVDEQRELVVLPPLWHFFFAETPAVAAVDEQSESDSSSSLRSDSSSSLRGYAATVGE